MEKPGSTACTRQIARIKHDVEFNLHNFGRSGGIMYGISAVDIALWDLAGKRAGRPLAELLGGATANEVEVYASLVRYGTEEAVRALRFASRRAMKTGGSVHILALVPREGFNAFGAIQASGPNSRVAQASPARAG